jgi:hypothetical protein
MSTPDSLESLWDELDLPTATPPRGKAAPAKPAEAASSYSSPENWEATCGVTLVHQDTGSVLGVFQEYRHRRDRSARKLVRAQAPLLATKVEVVSGPAWTYLEAEIPKPSSAETHREILLDSLPLEALGVALSSPAALRVCFLWGGIVRVELLEDLVFHSPDSKVILSFGKGTNILPSLDLQTKLRIREELK